MIRANLKAIEHMICNDKYGMVNKHVPNKESCNTYVKAKQTKVLVNG